jgi:hypothetical protein
MALVTPVLSSCAQRSVVRLRASGPTVACRFCVVLIHRVVGGFEPDRGQATLAFWLRRCIHGQLATFTSRVA